MKNLKISEIAWATYDFGNSAYALIVMTIFFPLFFSEFIVFEKNVAAYWGGSVALSILLVGFSSPIIGAYTDKKAKRKSFFVFFGIISIIGTMLLGYTALLHHYVAIIVFIATNSAFGISLSLYDSFVAVIPKDLKKATRLSGFGWAIGYVGGPLCLFLIWLILGKKFPVDIEEYKILFLFTGCFFFIFSLWPFLKIPQDPSAHQSELNNSSFAAVMTTIKDWKNYKNVFLFFLAMYLIMDGLTTIVYFVSLYAKNRLGFDINQIVFLLLIVQVVGIFSTALMALLAEKFGEINFLILCSFLWIIITISIYFSKNYRTFLFISAITGVVVGSTPAIARGFLGKIIPVRKRAEFYGFNTFAGRIATLFGPLIFGIASSLFDMKTAIFTVIPFFIAGTVVLFSLRKVEWKSYE